MLDAYYLKYEDIIFLRDFNARTQETAMLSFCKSYKLTNLIKQPTCFIDLCIDLILSNRIKSFQSACVIKTGLHDFHRMTVSVLKAHFRKLPRKND